MIDEIIKKLDHKKIKFNNLSFLAGDASDRRYFLIKQENITNVLMFDNDRKNLEKFIKISNLLKELVSVPKIIVDINSIRGKNHLIDENPKTSGRTRGQNLSGKPILSPILSVQ